MTNLSGELRQGRFKWLTPENAVVVLPVLAGLVMAALIAPSGIWPLSERVNNKKEEVELLRSKAITVPQLRQQLVELSAHQRLREQQLDRLLALVAGTSELNTFLAELNDLAYANGVVITTTEPGDVERFIPQSSPGDDAPPPAAGGDDGSALSDDALLMKGLEKRSAGLTVQGGFLQVYEFLRSLERLQVFVVVSEMNIQAQSQPKSQNENDEEALPEIRIILKLTAYGRQTDKTALVTNKGLEASTKEVFQFSDPS